MLKLPLLAIFFTIPAFLPAQEKSLQLLYEKTLFVYENIQHGEHLEALESADEMLEEYLQFPGSGKYIAYLYMYKAEAYLRLGDNLLSELCSKTAKEVAGKAGEKSLLFSIENNLAALDIEKQDYASCYDKCTRILENDGFKPTRNLFGAVLNNMALSAFKTSNFEAADSLFVILFELAKDSFPDKQFDRSLSYRNYGVYKMQVGQYEEAIGYFKLAAQLYRNSLGEKHFETLRSKLYLGDCLSKTGEPDSAMVLMNEVISILAPDSLSIRPSEYELLLIRSYLYRAEAWYRNRPSKNIEDRIHNMKIALEDLEKASVRILYLMQYYAAGESGYITAKLARPVYDLAFDLSINIFRYTRDKEYFFSSLIYSDKAKRLSLLIRNLSHSLSGLTPSLENTSREFFLTRQALARVKDSMAMYPNIDNTKNRMAEMLQQYSAIKVKLDSELGIFPMYGSYMEQGKISLNFFGDSKLISYHDLDSVFTVLSLNRRNYKEFTVNKSTELLQSIQNLKTLLSTPRAGSYSGQELERFVKLARYLYKELIEPLGFMNHGQIIYIQPDGEILGLPFEILLKMGEYKSENISNMLFRDLPFLIKDNPIYYLSSIFEAEGKPNINNERLHFDGHAFIDQENFKRSELDNGANFQQILSKDYLGYGVYLNGCETGLGPYYSGEGVMSLGLAYLLSGASQVIENFWMAPNHVSEEISREFYNRGGFKKPAKALRKAKLKYLENAPDGMDHPHYWAGTMVQGKPSTKGGNWILILIVLVLPLVLLIKRMTRFKLRRKNLPN